MHPCPIRSSAGSVSTSPGGPSSLPGRSAPRPSHRTPCARRPGRAVPHQRQEARDRLCDLVSFYQPAAADRDLPALRLCCLDLARAGRNLYNLILAPEALPKDVTRTVRRRFREVTDGDGVQSLEVVSEGQPWFAPWNVVYDTDPDEDLFLRADPKADGGVDLPRRRFAALLGPPLQPLVAAFPSSPPAQRSLPAQPRRLARDRPGGRDDLARHLDDAGLSQQANLLDFVTACEKAMGKGGDVARTAPQGPQEASASDLLARPCRPDRSTRPGRTTRRLLADSRNFLRDSADDDEPSPPGGPSSSSTPARPAYSARPGPGSFLRAFHNANFSGIIATEERDPRQRRQPLRDRGHAGVPQRPQTDRRGAARGSARALRSLLACSMVPIARPTSSPQRRCSRRWREGPAMGPARWGHRGCCSAGEVEARGGRRSTRPRWARQGTVRMSCQPLPDEP